MNEKREFQIKPKEPPAPVEIVNELYRRVLEQRKLGLRAKICELELLLRGRSLDRKECLFIKYIIVLHQDWVDYIEEQLGVMTPKAEPEDSEKEREDEA